MSYLPSYHAAVNHLIKYGAWYGDTHAGRAKCAKALRDLRRTKGREAARRERQHMKFICGGLPRKTSDPLHPIHDKK